MRLEHEAASFRFSNFDPTAFPEGVAESGQVAYIRCYLADLQARSVLEEPQYFDRDYLAEFVAFYATSARGYSNVCRRLHVFRCDRVELRELVFRALTGCADAKKKLQDHYLGFLVIRPTRATPIGRTVLAWYPERLPNLPRVTAPSRSYRVHIAGIRLSVRGLAWQQQDTAVGACATIALWSMFHSTALDDHLAVPTTAGVTKAANDGWSVGRRPFPAGHGLQVTQMCEAIRAQQLAPAVFEGDVGLNQQRAFSPARFRSTVAALLRSGYPVLICAVMLEAHADTPRVVGGHAVCAVGFRTPSAAVVAAGSATEDDGQLEHIYIHDDNLGPSVRFRILDVDKGTPAFVGIVPDRPKPLSRKVDLPDPTLEYPTLIPTTLVAALPDEIRLSSDRLYEQALGYAARTSAWLKQASGGTLPGVTFTARFFRVTEYLDRELSQRLSGRLLAKARYALATRVRPMSLHVGVVRLGIAGMPWVDILYDTTDSEPATLAFAHIVYLPDGLPPPLEEANLGSRIRAF